MNADFTGAYPYYKGYPYLVIRIVNSFFHINLLSAEQNDPKDLFRLAQAQADANKFDVCLVMDERSAVYFSSKYEPHFSEQIPWATVYTKDQLLLPVDQPVSTDLLRRKSDLEAFIQSTTKTRILMGDLTKGGRKATQKDLISLQGVQKNGLPKGLVTCPTCRDYRGECLDPNPMMGGLIVRVSCYCDNDALCAYCGGKLNNRKPNSNHYESKDGKIWHTPGFSGLSHRCPDASN
ncbi:MAG: hypothetical protein ABIJ57_04140 [Pseudomonadota bacterium]